MLPLLLSLCALAGGYENPPEEIARILDASRPPAVSISPDNQVMAMMERPQLAPIAEFAAPVVRVAGMQLNPVLRERARSYTYRGLALKGLDAASLLRWPCPRMRGWAMCPGRRTASTWRLPSPMRMALRCTR